VWGGGGQEDAAVTAAARAETAARLVAKVAGELGTKLTSQVGIEGTQTMTLGFRVGHRSRGPLRDTRRFPSTRWLLVPGATRTTLGFGICPSFKGQFLSRRAKP
jgi:hypothetical protein